MRRSEGNFARSPFSYSPPSSIWMLIGWPKTPIQELQKASQTSWGFSLRSGINREFPEKTSMTCNAKMSSKDSKSTYNFLLTMARVEVPAAGARGAFSKARRTSHCSSTSSAQVSKCALFLYKSTNSRFNCCADAWPHFACNHMTIPLGSVRRQSSAPPRVAALQAAKVSGVSEW